MVAQVTTRVPRGPILDVDGAYVRALRKTKGLSIMEFGSELGKEKATIQRWEKGAVDEITWLGMLTKLGLQPNWQPDAKTLDRAREEIAELRKPK